METILGARLCWDTAITTDHNHVSLEHHQGRELWSIEGGDASCTWASGRAARSMGSSSFHVEGRGHEAALCSSAHGAGRALSRTAAPAKVTEREFRRQMEGVCTTTDCQRSCETRRQLRTRTSRQSFAHSDLVKVTRVLRPVLNYKGT